jgi:hypothetical protein
VYISHWLKVGGVKLFKHLEFMLSCRQRGWEGGVVGPVWTASHNFKSETANVVSAEIYEETVESIYESLAMMNVLEKSPCFMQWLSANKTLRKLWFQWFLFL